MPPKSNNEERVLENTNEIQKIKDDLYSEIKGKEGLFIKINNIENKLKEVSDYIKIQRTLLKFSISIISFFGATNIFFIFKLFK